MYVTAKVGSNPFVEQASATAIVITDCPTGEELLDIPAVRKRLKQFMFASNPDAPNTWERTEQPLLIYRDANGNLVFGTPTSATLTACSNVYGIPSEAPGDSLLAIVHTHPAAPGDTIV